MASTERPTRLRDVPLERLFHPRTVAVIGASATSGSGPRLLWKTVRKKVESEGGRVFPVNPRRTELDGAPCFPSVADIGESLDLVVIAGGDPIEGLRQAAGARACFAMMFAAGFAEAGDEGARAQADIARIVDESGLFLLGPNTTLNSFLPLRDDLPGPKVALISHSGHQGRHLWEGERVGMPLAYWAPTGNEVDLEFADFVKFFVDQPEVGAVAGYVEGFKSGDTLRAAADYALSKRKPIVLSKVGRTSTGESTAASHTAHVAGSDKVADGVFAQYGIIRVDTLDELAHTSQFLARTKPPRATGVCVYTISGGTAAHLTDLAAAAGLSVPTLTLTTQQRLHDWIPDRLRVSNPVDSGGEPTGDERGRKILEALIDDPNVGVIVCPFVANAYHLSEALARDIVDLAETTDKPMCVIWGAPTDDAPVFQNVLINGKVHVFRTFQQCLTALRGYFDYHHFADAVAHRQAIPDPAETVCSIPGGVLDEMQCKQLLAAYGIQISHDARASDGIAAVAVAEKLGYPVVLKAMVPGVAHKARLGLVELGISSNAELAKNCERMNDAAPAPGITEFLVSKMEFGGVEAALGMVVDPVFGAVVMVGLGGVFLETVRDVSFRAIPFDATEAKRMINELHSAPALVAATGGDTTPLVDAIMSVQALRRSFGDRLQEIDINPALIRRESVCALDALMVVRD